MKSKKYLMIIVLVVALLLLGANNSHAVLQANGGTLATDGNGQRNWILKIRQMESLGGTLGLTETIDSTTLLPTSKSNNLDIHMEKNTEYGAIAILSASSYGNPNVIGKGGTSTGNKTGIVFTHNDSWSGLEVVAAYAEGDTNKKTISQKYYNSYKYNSSTSSANAKIGDATIETANWHGSKYDRALESLIGSYGCILRRGGTYNYSSVFQINRLEATTTYLTSARAIMICGEGI